MADSELLTTVAEAFHSGSDLRNIFLVLLHDLFVLSTGITSSTLEYMRTA
jgi:hypothetical protein